MRTLRTNLEANPAPRSEHAQTGSDLDALAALGYGGVDVLAHVPGALDPPEPGSDPRLVVGAVKLLNQVRAQAGAGEFEAAAAALAKLEALQPGEVMVREARGDFQLARGRRGQRDGFEHAADEFAAACELQPGRRGLWLRRFESLEALGRLTEALACLDHALELAPATPEFLRAREELKKRVDSGGG